MLSEEEKREMREDARSEVLRRDFALLQTPPRFGAEAPISLDTLIDFLTTVTRLSPQPPPPRPFIPYARVLL